MTTHTVDASPGWSMRLQATIRQAADGDTIKVPNVDMLALARLIHRRVCPDKKLVIEMGAQ